MTLLLLEGFESEQAEVVANFSYIYGGDGNYGVKTVAKRTGLQGYRASDVRSDSGLIWDLPVADRHATCIAGVAFYAGTTGTTKVLQFREGGTNHIYVEISSGGTITVRRGDGTSLATVSSAWTINTWHYIELKATIHDSTGSFSVRMEGANTIMSGSGVDTRNGGTNGEVTQVAWGGIAFAEIWYDDIFVCNGAGSKNNDLVGDLAVHPLYPNGNGNYSQWLGSDGNSTDNYLLVDEAGAPSGTDYVGSQTVGNKDSYTMENLIPVSGTVIGVEVRTVAKKSDTGAKQYRNLIRNSGSDAFGATKTLTTSWTYPREVFQDDPVAVAAWTISTVNSVEVGADVVA